MNIKLLGERDPNLSFAGQVLKNRGVQDLDDFFNLSEEDICSPYDLDYINEAADMLDKHIQADSKIVILVDSDMDGFSSAALLLNYIRMQIKYGEEWKDCNPEIVYCFHSGKMHGLGDVEFMRSVRDVHKPALLIVPDASGTEEQYNALTAIGIDVLVLDHHDTAERGNGETVIVVNNQQSKNYKNKDFSGVGVTWQLCRALDDRMTLVCADKWRDLVALGNCADVMDMRSRETRYLIMNSMGETSLNSYFLQFCLFGYKSMEGKRYTPHNISFFIAPMFNAVCRVGSLNEKTMLFRSLLDEDANSKVPNGKRGHDGEEVDLVEEALRLATNTKSRQDRRRNKLIEMIEAVIRDEGLNEHKVFVLAFDDFEEEYRAMSGVVAGRIAETWQRPVILTFLNADGSYSGSLRVPDGEVPAYKGFKDQCQESGLCTFVAGHQEAAGIGIKPGCVEELIAYFDDRYEELDTEVAYNVDFIMDANDPTLPDLIEELSKMADYWGTGLKEPKVAVKNVKIGPGTIALLGKNQTTLTFTTEQVKFITFSSSREEFDSLCLPYDGSAPQYYNATVIGSAPEMNVFGNRVTPQFKLDAYHLDGIFYEF